MVEKTEHRKWLYRNSIFWGGVRKYLMFYYTYTEGRQRWNISSTVIRIQIMKNLPVPFFLKQSGKLISSHFLRSVFSTFSSILSSVIFYPQSFYVRSFSNLSLETFYVCSFYIRPVILCSITVSYLSTLYTGDLVCDCGDEPLEDVHAGGDAVVVHKSLPLLLEEHLPNSDTV